MDRLTEMEAFTAVVEQGGFTGAARRLGISKSAVSKHISSLEGRLKVKLLERTTRRVLPTDIGLVYYERARMVLGAATDADQLVAAKSEAPEGLLRVAVADEPSERFIARSMVPFLKSYKRLQLHLYPVSGYVEPVRDGYDLVVTTGTTEATTQSQKLVDLTFVLVGSPGYLAKEGTPARIDDLSAHSVIHVAGGNGQPLFHLVSRSGERRPVHSAGRLIARDTAIVLEAIEAGAGIGFLPDFMVADAIADGRLVEILADLPEQKTPVMACFPPGDQTNPKVRAFLDHFHEERLQTPNGIASSG